MDKGENKIEVKVEVEGIFLGRKVKEKFDVSLKKGGTVKDLLKALDRVNKLGKRFFRDLPLLIDLPELSINGKSFHLIKDKNKKLNDGDYVFIHTNSKCR